MAFELILSGLVGGRSQGRIPKWKAFEIISILPTWVLLLVNFFGEAESSYGSTSLSERM